MSNILERKYSKTSTYCRYWRRKQQYGAYFPNQACLWGSYSPERISVTLCKIAVPPSPKTGSPRDAIWKSGNQKIQKSGNRKIQKSGMQKIKQMKMFKIKIRSAQNVHKVLISREKTPDPFSGHFRHFFHGPENMQKSCILTIFLGGPMAATYPVWGIGSPEEG